MSHLDTFDTKPGAENQGPIKSIRTNADGVQISQYFPELARHMDKIAVVNSMRSTVITSYSIHYTKLYDDHLRFSALS